MEKNANNTTNNASAPSDPTRYLTKLVWAWEVQDVVAWAREVLESPEQSLNILRAQGITGSTLFDPPVLRFSDLVALLPGVPTSMTKRMWDEIELLQRSHDGPGTGKRNKVNLDLFFASRLVQSRACFLARTWCVHKFAQVRCTP
jgi:hypothetical protein